MRDEILERINLALNYFTPFLLAFLAVFLSVVPVGLIPQAGAVTPNLLLIMVFFWGLHRPDLMPIPAVLLLGIFQDVLNGDLLGTNALLVVLVSGVIYQQRRFLGGKSFDLIWFFFGGVMIAVGLVSCLVNFTYNGGHVDWVAIFFKTFLTIILYPLMAHYLFKVHQHLLKTLEA